MMEPWEFQSGNPDQLTIDVTISGVPEDLSDRTWRAQWRPSPTSSTFINLAVNDSQADVGRLVLSVTAAQSASMTPAGVFDVLGSDDRTLLTGKTKTPKGVTR